ncbi:MAG TPA: DUF4398 domain-containing protein [Burkholderiales bacterium]|nr:DUF4398 domain-containing protein [Burkholderiales bacterium]
MRTLALFIVLAGCATVSPPGAELAAARTAVIQAEPAARRYAPDELRLAQEKLARAEQAMAREQWGEARRFAEQAEVDARLAFAIAENERARSAQ